jgi:hypothetical protein
VYFGKIYRFMDMNGIVQSLKSSTLRYSSTLKFNDPLDCSFYTINYLENVPRMFNRIKSRFKKMFVAETYRAIKGIFGEDNVLNELIAKAESDGCSEEDLSKIITDEQAESIFIKMLVSDPTIFYNPNAIKFCCFSKDYYSHQSALMWSHYADKHKGACLEFDFYKLAKDAKERSHYKIMRNRFVKNIDTSDVPFVVRYMKKIPKFKFTQSKKDFRWINTKSKIWSYEKEVRCILANSQENLTTEDVHFPYEYLSKVIFGKFSSQNEIDEIKAIIQDKYPNNNICFEQMEIDDDLLALIPENLEIIEERHRILKEKYEKYRI